MGTVPAGTEFQCNGNIHGTDYGVKNFSDQRLVLQQCRPAPVVTYFFGGTSHVDVDDLGALIDIVTGGIGHDGRVRADDLDGTRFLFFGVHDPFAAF